MQTRIPFSFLRLKRLPQLSIAAYLTISYFAFAILWIILSGKAASSLAAGDGELLSKIETWKGILFILITGGFLFTLSRKLYQGLEKSRLQKERIERKFHALNAATREGVFDFDIPSNTALLNEHMRFYFPARNEEVKNFWEAFKKRIHSEDRKRLIDEYHEVVRSDKTEWQAEFRLLGSDINYHTVISSIYLIRNKFTNEPQQLVGTFLDVTDMRSLQTDYYKQELEHKTTLASSIIKAQENERNRWAEELHDNVGQLLSVASMFASDLVHSPAKAETLAPEIRNLLLDSIAEIRLLSASIKSHSFESESLEAALDNLLCSIKRVKPIEFILTRDKFDESILDEEMKLMVYRIMQEQLNNIIKYADAGYVDIEMEISNANDVTISIRDDGKGFDLQKIKAGIGFRNIQSRLQVFGGKMQVDTAPGKGCTLVAKFKLKQ